MENEIFAVNQQVEYVRPMRSGNLVEIGSIVRLEEDKALVSFPTLYKSLLLPLTSLRATSHRFGSIQVSPSPSRRTLQTLMK